jgi:hypothetical protein
MYLYLVLLLFFAFSDSFLTEYSDYQIDNEEDAQAFEIKKRKLDDAGGTPSASYPSDREDSS